MGWGPGSQRLAAGGAVSQKATASRRDRWRDASRTPARKPRGGRWTQRLLWTGLFAATLLAVWTLVILPFFAWQTVVVGISVDDYDLAMIAPLPWGKADDAAVDAALDGLLAPAVARQTRRFADLNTSSGLENELRPLIAGLPLRPANPLSSGDVLVATIRGQTLVAPGDQSLAPATDPVGGLACLAASDLSLDGVRPQGLVSMRQIIDACAGSQATTTLIACDFGDLRWDPRLGVLGSFVPAALDRELAARADSVPSERRCWVLGSHAEGQLSGVHLASGRSFFSRALELGLSGAADAAPYGDGDQVIELDELFDFVRRWTAEWSRQTTGGTLIQTPVLWEVGVGRLAADEVPKGVRLLRLAYGRRRGAEEPEPETPTGADGADEPKTPAAAELAGTDTQPAAAPAGPADEATTATPQAATADAGPQPGGGDAEPPSSAVAKDPGSATPSEPQTFWEWAERAAPAVIDSPAEDGPLPRPQEYAPHLWEEVRALMAAAEATLPDGSPRATRAETLRREARRGWAIGGAPVVSREASFESVARRLSDSWRLAEREGFSADWAKLPARLRDTVCVFHDAITLAQSVVAVNGLVSGGLGPEPIDRELVTILIAACERLAVELEAIETAATINTRVGGGTQQNATAAAAVDRAVQLGHDLRLAGEQLRRAADQWIAALVTETDRPDAHRIHEIPWALATRLPTAEQRRLLRTALEAACFAGSGGEPLVVAPRPPPRDLAWRPPDAGQRRRLADAGRLSMRCGSLAVEPVASQPGSAAEAAEAAWKRVEEATDATAIEAIQDAASWSVELLGTQPIEIVRIARTGSLARNTAGPFKSDLLLRSLDPRDARRVPPAVLGHCLAWNAPRPILFQMRSDAPSLTREEPVRVWMDMLGNERFPENATLTPTFDDRFLVVTDRDGNGLRSGRPVPIRQVTAGNRLELRVRAGAVAATAEDSSARLTCSIAAGDRQASGEVAFALPSVEELVLFVRGRGKTVGGGLDAEGRLRVSVPAFGGGTTVASVPLRPFPGQITTWEFWLENRTGLGRRVDVELIAVGPRQAAARPPDRESLVAAAVRRTLSRSSRREIARIEAVDLPEGRRPIKVAFPDPPAQQPPAAEAGAEPVPTVEPGTLGNEWLLLVRDVEASAPTTEAAAAGPQPLAPDRRRTWVVPISVTAQPPKNYVDAIGRWLGRDRNVAIELKPAGDDSDRLPSAGARVRAEPLAAAGAGDAPLLLRKFETLLTTRQPRSSLGGTWNGADAGSAWLALEVDGYPRAHVLQIECGPAAAGVDQRPQADWRNVGIVRPAVDLEAFRAPAETIELTLTADAPPDAFRQNAGGEEGGRLELVVRERSDLASLNRGREQLVWSAAADRETIFTHAESPDPSASLAIQTRARDWQVSLAQPGFVDVDLELEARLFLPDENRPRTAVRRIVLDGSPPRVLVPPDFSAVLGEEAMLFVRAEDGLRNLPLENGRRSGASGIERVEWGITPDRALLPEKWSPAPFDGGTGFRVAVPTKDLAVTSRPLIAVRCFDRVGLESDVEICELRLREPAKMAADDPAMRPNDLTGRVLLEGRPQAGVQVTAVGPGAPPPAVTDGSGGFRFLGVRPGQYQVSVPQATIRNRLYKAEPAAVTVPPAPAPPAVVVLTLE